MWSRSPRPTFVCAVRSPSVRWLTGSLAGTKNVPLTRLLRLFSVGSLDKLGSLVGRPPIYITASAAPGEFGAISNEDAIAGLSLITPPTGTDWHNRVAARSLLGIGAHRPVRKAANIGCPILLIVAETDTIAPIGPALRSPAATGGLLEAVRVTPQDQP